VVTLRLMVGHENFLPRMTMVTAANTRTMS
jgi:hypothetical protein